MVIDINDKLLESIKKELLETLRATEARVVDMFEFGETHGSAETIDELLSVRSTLLMIGEKKAASLCKSIQMAIVDAIENDDIEEHEGLADSFLTLSQYVERLVIDGSQGISVAEREQQLLANAQKSLSPNNSSSDGSEKVYRLSDKQKGIVDSALKAITNSKSEADSVFWKAIYKTARIVKNEVNTQESHELIWLIEQAAILNVKGNIQTGDVEKQLIFSVYYKYLKDISANGETLSGYSQQEITNVVILLKQMSSAHEVLRNDYRPPQERLHVSDVGGLSLSIVFPVSAETIETIAFLVKKELATSKQVFEQALVEGGKLSTASKLALIKSLELPKASFRLLNFNAGHALLEEAESLISDGVALSEWQAQFAENLILVDDALWQLDYLDSTGIINPYDAANQQKTHTKNMAAEQAKIIVSESAYNFFKSSREALIENFNSTESLDLVEGAKAIHEMRSSVILLGEETLADNLLKAEQLQLFLVNKPNALTDSTNADQYINMLVSYEIIFDQLKTSLAIDQRALKLSNDAQNKFSASVHFNPEQMANVDFMPFPVSSGELPDEFPEQDNIDDISESLVEGASESLELESFATDDGSVSETELNAADEKDGFPVDSMSPAFANVSQRAKVDENIHSLPQSEIDADILEIFLEEGRGIAEKLATDIAELKDNYFDENLIGELRRSFHTLKGSGRMVGLNVFGEFAWQHEELLNKVVSGNIELSALTQELFESANHVVDTTVNSEPFAEDRQKLLFAAGQAKALRDALLSGEDLSVAASDSQSESVDSFSIANTSDARGPIEKEFSSENDNGAIDITQLSEADLDKVADRLSERVADQRQQTLDVLEDVSLHPALFAEVPQHNNLHDEKIQKIAQTASLIGGLGEVVHEDLAAIFNALGHIDENELDEKRQKIAKELDELAEISRESLGGRIEQSQVSDIANAITCLQSTSSDELLSSSQKALELLKESWFKAKEEEIKLDFSLDEDVSWTFSYADANKKLFEAWRKDDFAKQRAFNGLHQNMIGFERLLLNNRLHNPIALISKIRELLDAIAVFPSNKSLDELITNAVHDGLVEVRLMLEALQGGENDAIAEVGVMANIERSLSELTVKELPNKPSESPIEFDLALAPDEGFVSPSEDSTNAATPLSIDAAQNEKQELPAQMRSKVVASGYLGESGPLSDNIDAVKTQFLPSNLVKGEFQHSQLIDSLYDIEASLDEQEVPDWTWEALSNLESAVSSMSDKSLLPSPADYDRIKKVLEAIQNNDDIDAKEARNINNSLMGLRAELTARHETAAVAKQFADRAHEELLATDQSFDEWKGSGFVPSDKLSGLISNFNNVSAKSKAVEYDDAEELSTLVSTVLNRLKDENVVPFEEISDIVGEAVNEITTVSSQFHGDSLVSEDLKKSLEKQGIVSPVGVEYVPVNDIDDLKDVTPVNESEVDDIITRKVATQTSVNESSDDAEEFTCGTFSDDKPQVDDSSQTELSTSNVKVDDASETHLKDEIHEVVVSENSATPDVALGVDTPDFKGLEYPLMSDEQKQDFSKEASKHIKSSRKQFDRWEKTGFTDDARLERLSQNVGQISRISEKNAFYSVKSLSDSVQEVLDRIYTDALVPNEEATSSVSDAIDEFGRASHALKSGGAEPHEQRANPDLLTKIRTVADMEDLGTPTLDDDKAHAALVAERKEKYARKDSFDDYQLDRQDALGLGISQEIDYQSYIEEVRLAIEDSQDSFNNWKASDFTDADELESLSDSVKEIKEGSERNSFESGAELGESVEGVLSQIADSGKQPSAEEAQQVESAVEEFSRSAEAITEDRDDKDISQNIVNNVRSVIRTTEVSSSFAEKLREDGAHYVDSTSQANYQAYANEARSAIESSQQNFDDWKASDFANTDGLDQLSSNIEHITDTSEKHGFESGAELGKSIGEALSTVVSSGEAPSEELTKQVESAVDEFSRSAQAIDSNEGDKEIRQDVINSVRRVIQTTESISHVAHDDKVELQSEQTTVVERSVNYDNYLEEAKEAISNSKRNFDNWRSSDFSPDENLDNLFDNVQDIADTSEKHGFESGAELGKSIGEALSTVASSGEAPSEELTKQVESAVDEFSRSAQAIDSNEGDKEIRQDVINSVRRIIQTTESISHVAHEDKVELQSEQTTVVERSVNYDSYLEEAKEAISNSKRNFDNWRSSDFSPDENLDNLFDNVQDIADTSEKHGFESGAELGKSIGEALSTVASSGEAPSEELTKQVESAVDEFSRSAQAIDSNEGDKEIRQDVINSVRRIIQTTESISHVAHEDKVELQSEQTTVVERSVNYDSYLEEAKEAISNSKRNFDNWRSSDFSPDENLDNLFDNVQDIADTSEKHGFESGAELGKSIGEALSTVASSGEAPSEELTKQVESAVDEFSRSAQAIDSNEGDKEIRQDVINSVRRVIQTTESISHVAHDDKVELQSEQTTVVERSVNYDNHDLVEEKVVDSPDLGAHSDSAAIEQTVAKGSVVNYDHYAKAAKPAVENSKIHFDDWKSADFEPNEQLASLADDVRSITKTSEDHSFESGAELGHSVGSILSQTAASRSVPEKVTADHVESAVSEFSRSIDAIENGNDDVEINQSIIEKVGHVAQNLVTASASASVNEALANSGQNAAHLAYAQEAIPAIESSKNSFESWKISDFGVNDELSQLSGDVREISVASTKYGIDDATELAESIGEILSQVMEKGAAPTNAATDSIESAIDEFSRSAHAIQGNNGVQQIRQEVIANIQELLGDNNILTTQSMLVDPTPDAHKLQESEQEQLVLEQAQLGTGASSRVKPLTKSVEEGIDQPEEQSGVASIAQPNLNTTNAYGNLKFNDPTTLDEVILDIFLSEAKDLTVQNATSLADWKEDNDDLSALQSIQRGLHTLKGGARMAELTVLGDLSHNIEVLLDAIVDGQVSDNNEAHNVLQRGLNLTSDMVMLADSQQVIIESPEYHELLNSFLREQTGKTLAVTDDKPKSEVLYTPVQLGAEASSLADQLANQSAKDFEEVVNQSAEQSGTNVPDKPKPSSANAYDGLKFNDPTALDETILDIFLSEAKDLTVKNNTSLADWKEDNDDLSALQNIQRGLHTLKGGARMAELTVLGDLSHNIEVLLDAIVEGQVTDKDEAHNVLQGGLNLTSEMVMLADSQQVIVESPEYYELLNAFLREQTGKALTLPAPKRQILDKQHEEDSDQDQALSANQARPSKRNKLQRRSYMMRVSSDLIDRLTGLVGEDVISRSRIERNLLDHGFQIDELSRTVDRASEQLRRLENETEAQILFRHDVVDEAKDEEFDPLELDRFSEIQQLSRLLAESMHDLESIRSSLTDFIEGTRQALLDQNNIQRELQDGVLSASLVRFDSVAPRFERMVEQVAAELGKEVMVQIYGGHNDIERNMLEDLIPGFEHTIRNSLAHGIETPEEREKVGKPRQGRIRIAVRREGAEIGFMIADDGRGANLDAIRDKARRLNMLDESKADDKNYLLQLLFEPGFSTQETATQISGRGIGMDVLRDVIDAHQGNIDVESEVGKGMATFIRLPFAMSITEALSVRIGRYQYAIPVMSIEGIARIPNEDYDLFESGQTTFHTYGQNRYKIESLTKFIDPYAERVVHSQGVPVLLVRVGSKRLALAVEEIETRQEIIIKSVNPQFTSLPGIIGATVLDNGLPVPVMETTTLGRHFLNFTKVGEDIRDVIQPESINAQDTQTKVLVVDDSITMRKVTAKILARYDVEYQTAKDGLDAIDVISDWTPDIILLDIEMPRMDGFEFAMHIRNDSEITSVPIIMITSRTGNKHRERAESIGVNDYLGKPYNEEKLVASIEAVLNKKLEK